MFTPKEAVKRLLGLKAAYDWEIRHHISPTQEIPVVIDGQVLAARWGFSSARGGVPLINARSETALQKPTWSGPVRHTPCLFLMNGYFEWSMESGRKQPFYIFSKEVEVLQVAGCYRKGPQGIEAVLLTCAPRSEIAHLHDRMLLILDQNQASAWIKCPNERQNLLKMRPSTLLSHHGVDPRMGRGGRAGAEIIAPFELVADPQLKLL